MSCMPVPSQLPTARAISGFDPFSATLHNVIAGEIREMRAKLEALRALEGAPPELDRDVIARDIEASVKGVRQVHHVHVWSIDGSNTMATLHACLREGVDPHRAVGAIKKRLATQHGIAHVTVEPEFGLCADGTPEHDFLHATPPHHGHYH